MESGREKEYEREVREKEKRQGKKEMEKKEVRQENVEIDITLYKIQKYWRKRGGGQKIEGENREKERR